ncbi:MAG: hypothetical protein JNK23_10655 [Opitutaceae bacterium]|nr:hypothetical protein [Opitutaceae bacterium]
MRRLLSSFLVLPSSFAVALALGVLTLGPGAGVAFANRVVNRTGGGGPPATTAWVTGSPAGGSLRNNYVGFVGCKFTVGGAAITVTELGRWVVSGSTGTHSVTIFAADLTTVIATASVSTSGAAAGDYKWQSITPVALSASTTYYIASLEQNGGDSWYDSQSLAVTSAATLDASAYGNDTVIVGAGATGQIYVPVNFKYY